MNIAFVIVRVSAEDQLKGYGPDVQWEDDVLPNAPTLGLTVSEEYRRIIQESATGWERTKFEGAVREAMALHSKGEVEVLLFPRVDRETRFIFGSMPLLTEVVKSGLRVCFAREKLMLDPNDPESIERYLNKAVQSQAYIQTMKLNTSWAKKKLVREGKLPQGTGKGLYGYDWDGKNKKRVVNDREADIVREVFSRVAMQDSLVSIARSLNQRCIPTKGSLEGERKLWHSLTIRRIIRNPGYIGKTTFTDTLLPEVTPAIVSEAIYQAANAELDRPKVRTGRPKHEYLLRNHAFCAICGKPLVGHCLNKRFLYYQCNSARPFENHGKLCSARYIRTRELEEMVWEKTKEVLSNPSIILTKIQDQLTEATDNVKAESVDTEIEKLEQNLRRYERRRSNLLEAMELDFDKNEVLDRMNNLKRLTSEDTKKLEDLKAIKENITRLAGAKVKIGELYDRVLSNLENCQPETKRLAFAALDIKVFASTDKVEIQGVIPLELPTTEQTSECLPFHAYVATC